MPREPVLSKYLHQKGNKLGLPISGTFELTPRCNFNCKMCYVHLSEQEQRRRGQELTAEQWIRLGEQACKQGMVFLLLTGGEALLRPDFPQIYRALKKMGLIITVNTNGYLLRDNLRELFCEEPPCRLNISLYGTSDETYQRLCGIPAYETIVENVRALRQAGVRIRLSMSLTGYNYEDMTAVYRQAQELGVETQAAAYMFPPVRITGRFGEADRLSAQQAGACEVDYMRLKLSREEFLARAANYRDGVREQATEDCEGVPGAQMACRAGRSSFWISWDGTMTPCGMMPVPAEDVRKQDFGQAWQNIRSAVSRIRLPKECTQCRYRHACHACAAMCYCETGHFDAKPEYVCRMTEERVKLAMACLKEEDHETEA